MPAVTSAAAPTALTGRRIDRTKFMPVICPTAEMVTVYKLYGLPADVKTVIIPFDAFNDPIARSPDPVYGPQCTLSAPMTS